MTQLDLFIQRMVYWTTEANLGYDQGDRWNIYDHGECDCSSLTYWCLWEANLLKRPADYRTRTLYTGTIARDLVAAGWQRLPADISILQPGDVLLSEGAHVCVCVAGHGWGASVAEANYGERGASGNVPGDQTGRETRVTKVYQHSCGWDCILRLPGAEPAPAPAKLAVDGRLGEKSVTEWQRQCGTVADGIVSGQWKGNWHWFPNLFSVSWGGTGSALVMAVQRRCGCTIDGIIGPNTVKAIQRFVGVDADGYLGPETAKAIQRSLNAGRWS